MSAKERVECPGCQGTGVLHIGPNDQALYGEGKGYARPLKMFTERVERDGYKGPRFVLVK